MDIIKKFLPPSEYFTEKIPKKTRICIHHTQGNSAASSIEWWKSQPDKVGTAYVIDRDGTVYQAFPDEAWAYQFGLKNVAKRMEYEKTTIGIELANLGPITKLASGAFVDQYGKPFKGATTNSKWRGFEYWEDYTKEQYDSLRMLLGMIRIKYNFPYKPSLNIEFDLSVFDKCTVITHANVRRDKTDVSPAFNWSELNDELPF
jgi:N-acetyl-anhydromuramyl-L-alanine amidase AmpD